MTQGFLARRRPEALNHRLGGDSLLKTNEMLAESVENPSHQKRGKRLRNGLVGSVRPALVGWSGTLKEGWDGHLVAENRLFRGRYRQISVAIPMASRPTGQFPSSACPASTISSH